MRCRVFLFLLLLAHGGWNGAVCRFCCAVELLGWNNETLIAVTSYFHLVRYGAAFHAMLDPEPHKHFKAQCELHMFEFRTQKQFKKQGKQDVRIVRSTKAMNGTVTKWAAGEAPRSSRCRQQPRRPLPGGGLVLIIRTVVSVLILFVPNWSFIRLKTSHHGLFFREWLKPTIFDRFIHVLRVHDADWDIDEF